MLPESWKWVPGFKGWYKASTFGRIKSVNRTITVTRRHKNGRLQSYTYAVKGKILAPSTDKDGYLSVVLTKNGKGKLYKIHYLVLRTFIGPRPKGAITRHFPNRDRSNNRLDNLQYGTRSENQTDRVWHGTISVNRGELHGMAKITNKQAKEIIRRRKEGERRNDLAKEFGMSPNNVYYICSGRSFKGLL